MIERAFHRNQVVVAEGNGLEIGKAPPDFAQLRRDRDGPAIGVDAVCANTRIAAEPFVRPQGGERYSDPYEASCMPGNIGRQSRQQNPKVAAKSAQNT